LDNAGFESPSLPAKSYRIMPEANLPAWSTTASDQMVEVWSTGFLGVPAAEGEQFAELNANLPSALFQDVTTTPGSQVTWSLAHRGRSGVDTMRLLIGPAGGSLTEVAVMSDDNKAWGRHGGSYVIPRGQTMTRFQFEAVSTAGGNKSVGNFLDDIAFGTPACVQVTKHADVLGDAVPGARVRWTITATNVGGAPATDVAVTDSIPAHTTYATNTLRVESGPRAGAMTDENDSDQAAASGRSLTWKPVGASRIAGRLNPDESAVVSFVSAIDDAASGVLVANIAHASYLANESEHRSESTKVTVQVIEGADVYINKMFDPAAQSAAAGTGPANFVMVAGNHGPFAAHSVVIVDVLPIGLTVDSSAITIDGKSAAYDCSTRSVDAPTPTTTLTCILGTLPPSTMRVISVPATFTKSTPGTALVENTVSISTTTYDLDRSNNSAAAQLIFDPGAAADVAVRVAALGDRFWPGDDTAWNVDVFNATAVGLPATGISLTLALPSGVTSVVAPVGCSLVADHTVISCTIASLDAAAHQQFVIRAAIDANAVAGTTLTLRATVSADNPGSDSNPANNVDEASVSVVRPASVSVSKKALDPVTQDGTRFEVTVSSNGPFAAVDVALTDTAVNGIFIALPDMCSASGTVVSCSLGTLEVGATVTLEFTVTAVNIGENVVNTVTANALNASDSDTATASASPVIPEYGEMRLRGGLAGESTPPPLAMTGDAGSRVGGITLVVLISGLCLIRRRRA
jgi:uncharacterized repeat protein (TIGR01451 family)